MSQFFENPTKTGSFLLKSSISTTIWRSPVPNFECTSMRTPIQPRPETLWQPRLRQPVSPASFPLFFVDFSKTTILMHTEPLNDCLPKVASRMPQSGLNVAKEHVLFLDKKKVCCCCWRFCVLAKRVLHLDIRAAPPPRKSQRKARPPDVVPQQSHDFQVTKKKQQNHNGTAGCWKTVRRCGSARLTEILRTCRILALSY